MRAVCLNLGRPTPASAVASASEPIYVASFTDRIRPRKIIATPSAIEFAFTYKRFPILTAICPAKLYAVLFLQYIYLHISDQSLTEKFQDLSRIFSLLLKIIFA